MYWNKCEYFSYILKGLKNSVFCGQYEDMTFVSGGSETFTEKQYFFYYEVRRFHLKHKHEPITIKITRQNLLKSVSLLFLENISSIFLS